MDTSRLLHMRLNVHQSLNSEIKVKWKKLKSFVSRRICYFELGIFSFYSYVYYLTRDCIASTCDLNLLTRAFDFQLVHLTCTSRFYSVLTREFKFIHRRFELVTCMSELITPKSCFTFHPLSFKLPTFFKIHDSKKNADIFL